MANDEEVQMPSSQGGLVQYFDADTGVNIDPKVLVGVITAVAVIELALNMGILTA